MGSKGQKRLLNRLNKRKAELEEKVKAERVVKAEEPTAKGLSPLARAQRETRVELAQDIKNVRKILFDKKATPKEKQEAKDTLKKLRGKIKKGAVSFETAVPKLMQAGRELAKLKKRGSEIQQILSSQIDFARKRSQLLADAAQARKEGNKELADEMKAERLALEKGRPNVAKLQAEYEQISKQIRDIENRPATKEEEQEIGEAEGKLKRDLAKLQKLAEEESAVAEPVNEVEVLKEKTAKPATSTAPSSKPAVGKAKYSVISGNTYGIQVSAKYPFGTIFNDKGGSSASYVIEPTSLKIGKAKVQQIVMDPKGTYDFHVVSPSGVKATLAVAPNYIQFNTPKNVYRVYAKDSSGLGQIAKLLQLEDVEAFKNMSPNERYEMLTNKLVFDAGIPLRDIQEFGGVYGHAFSEIENNPALDAESSKKVQAYYDKLSSPAKKGGKKKSVTEIVEESTELEDLDDAEVIREAIGDEFSLDSDGNVYRRGAAENPVDEAEAKSLIDGIKPPEGVKFVYSYTYDGLPAEVKAQLGGDTSQGASVSFGKNSGIVSNESVLGGLRRVQEDDGIASEYPERTGAVMLTGLDRQAGGKKGRASDVLKALTNWADKNNESLVLMPSASGELKQPALISWYERNGFVRETDGAMVRSPQKVRSDIKGAVLPDGTVVVIGEAHSNTVDMEKTVAHEVVGHYGVDTVLGPKGMKDLTARTMRMEGGIQKLAESFGKDVGEATLSTAIYYQRMADQARAEGNEKRAKELEELGRIQAMRELIAHVEETRPTAGFLQKANRFIKELVGSLRAALRKMGLKSFGLDKVSSSDIYKILRDARNSVGKASAGVYVSPTNEIAFRKQAASYSANISQAAQRATDIVGSNRKSVQDVLANNAGLRFVTKFVDRFAPLERVAAFMKDAAQATQMMYFLRMHDQGIAWTQAVLTKGPLKLVKDNKGYLMLQTGDGPNIKKMVEALKDANVGNPEATKKLFTTYLLAERAEIVGYDKLKSDLGIGVSHKDLKEVLDLGRKNAAFQEAKKIYNEHNNGLIDALVDSGAMSKEDAAKLKNKSYVPYYRIDKNGEVNMFLGGEGTVRIGDIKNQPYLHELVGGNEKILDVFASSVQNTRLLTDMALRNLATRNAAFGLQSAGMLRDDAIRDGDGPASPDVIRFKLNGEKKYAVVDSDKAGIPAELLVSGMEGIRVAMPVLVRTLSAPAGILRKFITRNPVYAMRQIVRDSTTNYFLTGTDSKPIGSAAANMYKLFRNKRDGSMPDLQSRGIVSGNVLTGTSEQMEDILLNMVSGKPGWEQYMAKLDIMAQHADEASRISIYNDFIKQGLSDMEATMATLESMNFNKRGTSPSLFMLNAMVPFLNAQVQGLNVLQKSLRGKMPFAERLKQRKKLANRAMFLAASTVAYSLMMSDDEAYETSDPADRYNNWFVRVPGLDEPVRIPIPFEVGLLFKAIPEAMMDYARGDAKAEQAVYGMKRLLTNATPLGPSSLPAGIKPIVELTLGSSFYSGLPIESAREKQLLPEYRTREKTTEVAKSLGSLLGVSPVQVDYLINGYLSSTGLALAGMGNFVLRAPDAPQQAEKTLSEMPVIGSLFQTNTGSGYVNTFYRQAQQIEQAKATFDALIKKGDADGATRLVETSARDIALDGFVSNIKQQLTDLRDAEKAIRASDMDRAEKAKTIKDLRISASALTKAANQAVASEQ